MDEFFEPLVGTPEKVAGLQSGDAQYIHDPSVSARIPDPYQRLEDGLCDAVTRSVNQGKQQGTQTLEEAGEWSSIEVNGMIGIKLATAGLRTVGAIYRRNAQAQQLEAVVRESAMRTVRYVHGIAFSDSLAGSVTLGALRYGLDPHKPFMTPASIFGALRTVQTGRSSISRRAFTTVRDDDGQLHVNPKFKKLPGTLGSRCPATDIKVVGPEHRRSALLTLLYAAGSIAVNDIYPEQFEMTTS